jgi:rhodanese-related sulfurtransferase
MNRDEFIRFLTADLPETPRYFPMDVEINRRGATSLEPGLSPKPLRADQFKKRLDEGAQAIDVRSSEDYARCSVPRSLNIGLEGQFASWAGTLIDPACALLIVAANENAAHEAWLRLARVGLERVDGWLAGGLPDWVQAGFPVDTLEQVTVRELQDRLAGAGTRTEAFQVVDVRRPGEWSGGHIAGAVHAPLHAIEDHAVYLDPKLKTFVICGGGYRSVMGALVLRELGVEQVVDVKGGMAEWKAQGLPTTTS